MIAENLHNITSTLPQSAKLAAVSKFHPVEELQEAYDAGQRLFAENRPQEFFEKVCKLGCRKGDEFGLPVSDIEWHFIGHLQTNKLKLVLPYADMVESVDSLKLLTEIDKWGKANSKVTDILLEMHIAAEDSKQGFYEEEILELIFKKIDGGYPNTRFCGLMGMATNTDDMEIVGADFQRISDFMAYLNDTFPELTDFRELSIGMSNDYKTALEHGSTIVRIGTAIFGPRQY